MIITKTEMILSTIKRAELVGKGTTLTEGNKGILANQTGVVNKWVLVHDGTTVIINQENVDQETVSLKDIETFDTEEELNNRVKALGLVYPEPRVR